MSKIVKRRKVFGGKGYQPPGYYGLVYDGSDPEFFLNDEEEKVALQNPTQVLPPVQESNVVQQHPVLPSTSKSTLFHVNSFKRIAVDNTSNSDFFYRVDLPHDHDYDSVVITMGIFPKSWYSIQQSQNTMTLKEGAVSATITIGFGSYNINDFMTVFLAALTAQSRTNGNNFTYTGTYMALTNTWAFTVNSGAVLVEFIFGSFLASPLGFDPDSTNIFTTNLAPNTLNSVGIINMNSNPPPMLYIFSDLVENEDFNYPNLLETVPVAGAPWGYTTYICPDLREYAKKMRSTKSNVFRFLVTDYLGNEFDLNDQPLLFTVKCFRNSSVMSEERPV